MTSQSLTWNGPALTAKMRAAQKTGVNATMSLCVKYSKNNHPWQNQTATLEGDIQVAEFAREEGAGVVGVWGVRKNDYALILELGGVINHPGGTAYFIGKDGKAVFVSNKDARAADLPRTKPHQIVIPAFPYLRPSADVNYPQLAAKIRAAFEGSGAKASDGSQEGLSDA